MKYILLVMLIFSLSFNFVQNVYSNNNDFDLQYFIQEDKVINSNQKLVIRINNLYKNLVYTQDYRFFILLDTKLTNILTENTLS
jgi:hypothetical protein